MKLSYYILILIIGFVSCNSSQENNSVEQKDTIPRSKVENNESKRTADSLNTLYVSIDSNSVYSIIQDFKIPDSIAANSAEIEMFKSYLFNKDEPNARFMKRSKIDDRSELLLIHENIFHDNFIYAFIINSSDQSISDNLLLAGRLNFEGSKTIESSMLQMNGGKLEINQIIKECYDCADVGSNYPVLICDSCITESSSIYFDRYYSRIMTNPNKK